ncbi:MAG: hypothetical protein AB8B83_07105 [Bdellovibrionales bacterium]
MIFTLFKIFFSASIIAFTSWLAGKRPELAGFIIALPLMTMIVLPFNFAEYQDSQNTITFARSILVAVPLSLTFFIPFLLADKIMAFAPEGYGFWCIYLLGFAFLSAAYFVHQHIMNLLH